jgi:hypothetical protein
VFTQPIIKECTEVLNLSQSSINPIIKDWEEDTLVTVENRFVLVPEYTQPIVEELIEPQAIPEVSAIDEKIVNCEEKEIVKDYQEPELDLTVLPPAHVVEEEEEHREGLELDVPVFHGEVSHEFDEPAVQSRVHPVPQAVSSSVRNLAKIGLAGGIVSTVIQGGIVAAKVIIQAKQMGLL